MKLLITDCIMSVKMDGGVGMKMCKSTLQWVTFLTDAALNCWSRHASDFTDQDTYQHTGLNKGQRAKATCAQHATCTAWNQWTSFAVYAIVSGYASMFWISQNSVVRWSIRTEWVAQTRLINDMLDDAVLISSACHDLLRPWQAM